MPVMCPLMMDKVMNSPANQDQWESFCQELCETGWTFEEIYKVLAKYEKYGKAKAVNAEMKQFYERSGRKWTQSLTKEANKIPWEFNKGRLIEYYREKSSVRVAVEELAKRTLKITKTGVMCSFALCDRTAHVYLTEWGVINSKRPRQDQSGNTLTGYSEHPAPNSSSAILNNDSWHHESECQQNQGGNILQGYPASSVLISNCANFDNDGGYPESRSLRKATYQRQYEGFEESEHLDNMEMQGEPAVLAKTTATSSYALTPMEIDSNYPGSQQSMPVFNSDAPQHEDETMNPYGMHKNPELQHYMEKCHELKTTHELARSEWTNALILVRNLEVQVEDLKVRDSSNKTEINRLERELNEARHQVDTLEKTNQLAVQDLKELWAEYECKRQQLEALKRAYEEARDAIYDAASEILPPELNTRKITGKAHANSSVDLEPVADVFLSPNRSIPKSVEGLIEPPPPPNKTRPGPRPGPTTEKFNALFNMFEGLHVSNGGLYQDSQNKRIRLGQLA